MKDKELLLFEHELHLKEIEARKKAELEIEAKKFDNQLQRIRNASIERNILRKHER
jgi:hypothetical protein